MYYPQHPLVRSLFYFIFFLSRKHHYLLYFATLLESNDIVLSSFEACYGTIIYSKIGRSTLRSIFLAIQNITKCPTIFSVAKKVLVERLHRV